MGPFQLPLLDHRGNVGTQILLSFPKKSGKGPHRHRLPLAETPNCLSELRLRKSTPVNVSNKIFDLFRKIIGQVGSLQGFLIASKVSSSACEVSAPSFEDSP